MDVDADLTRIRRFMDRIEPLLPVLEKLANDPELFDRLHQAHDNLRRRFEHLEATSPRIGPSGAPFSPGPLRPPVPPTADMTAGGGAMAGGPVSSRQIDDGGRKTADQLAAEEFAAGTPLSTAPRTLEDAPAVSQALPPSPDDLAAGEGIGVGDRPYPAPPPPTPPAPPEGPAPSPGTPPGAPPAAPRPSPPPPE